MKADVSMTMKQLRAKVKPLLRGLEIEQSSNMFQKRNKKAYTETCGEDRTGAGSAAKKPSGKQNKEDSPTNSKELHIEVEARLRELGGIYSERWIPLLLRASAAEAEAVARMAEGQAEMAKQQEEGETTQSEKSSQSENAKAKAAEEKKAKEEEKKAKRKAKKQAKKEAKKAKAKKEAEEEAKKEAGKAQAKKGAEEEAKKEAEEAAAVTAKAKATKEADPVYPFGDGGWASGASADMALLDDAACDVERMSVDAIDEKLFMQEYHLKKPLILTGITKKWPSSSFSSGVGVSAFTKASLLKNYGGKTMKVGRAPLFA
jgi:hypothetical protein